MKSEEELKWSGRGKMFEGKKSIL